jgi:hypothetical protein
MAKLDSFDPASPGLGTYAAPETRFARSESVAPSGQLRHR